MRHFNSSLYMRTGYSVIVPGNLVRCLGAEGIFSMPPPGIFRFSRSQRVRMHEYTLAARTYARVRAQGHSAHRGVRGPRITADSSAFKLPPPGIFSMHVYTHAGRNSGVHARSSGVRSALGFLAFQLPGTEAEGGGLFTWPRVGTAAAR